MRVVQVERVTVEQRQRPSHASVGDRGGGGDPGSVGLISERGSGRVRHIGFGKWPQAE